MDQNNNQDELLVEGQFGHGGLADPPDDRDRSYDEAVGATVPQPIDWVKGYDIRNVIGGDIKKKNQYRSMSCGGQGIAYYVWVLQIIEMVKKYGKSLEQLMADRPDEVAEISARYYYSQTNLGYGNGSTLRDNILLAAKTGGLTEGKVSSYKPDGTTDETLMIDKTWLNAQMLKLAAVLKGKEARTIFDVSNIELFAMAIRDNFGVYGGVIGSNGHGWGYDENPTPPSPGDALWGHCLFFGAYGTDELGKFIATPNSWGDYVKTPKGPWRPGFEPGYGWQKLRENYFKANWIFSPWTYTDIPNEENLKPTPVPSDYSQKFNVNVSIIYGMRNALVNQLQKALVKIGYLDAKYVTGYYGSITAAAVLKFQLGYNVDVIATLKQLAGKRCGPKTLTVLNSVLEANYSSK